MLRTFGRTMENVSWVCVLYVCPHAPVPNTGDHQSPLSAACPHRYPCRSHTPLDPLPPFLTLHFLSGSRHGGDDALPTFKSGVLRAKRYLPFPEKKNPLLLYRFVYNGDEMCGNAPHDMLFCFRSNSLFFSVFASPSFLHCFPSLFFRSWCNFGAPKSTQAKPQSRKGQQRLCGITGLDRKRKAAKLALPTRGIEQRDPLHGVSEHRKKKLCVSPTPVMCESLFSYC